MNNLTTSRTVLATGVVLLLVTAIIFIFGVGIMLSPQAETPNEEVLDSTEFESEMIGYHLVVKQTHSEEDYDYEDFTILVHSNGETHNLTPVINGEYATNTQYTYEKIGVYEEYANEEIVNQNPRYVIPLRQGIYPAGEDITVEMIHNDSGTTVYRQQHTVEKYNINIREHREGQDGEEVQGTFYDLEAHSVTQIQIRDPQGTEPPAPVKIGFMNREITTSNHLSNESIERIATTFTKYSHYNDDNTNESLFIFIANTRDEVNGVLLTEERYASNSSN